MLYSVHYSPRRSRLFCSVIAIMSAFGASHLCAQTSDDTTEVVITGRKASNDQFGDKSGIALKDMPQSVQIITKEAISEAGYRSAGEILKAIPSASPGNSRISRYQSFSLKVRGFMADQMRNGIRQRYYEDVDASALSNIERVEVLKGPSSVLFGESALGGVISYITKSPTKSFAAETALTLGTDDLKIVTFDVGGPVSDKLGVRLTGEVERSGTFVDVQDINRANIALNVHFAPNERIDARFIAEYIERESLSNPGLPVVGTVVSNGTGTIDRKTYLGEPNHSKLVARAPLIQALVDIRLSPEWTLSPRFQYSKLDTPFSQIRVRGVDVTDQRLVTRNGRDGSEDDDYTIYQLDLKGTLKHGSVKHNLLVGFEHSIESSTFNQYNYAAIPAINGLNPTYMSTSPVPVFAFYLVGDANNNALYVQDHVKIGEKLGIVGAVRYSEFKHYSGFNRVDDILESNITTWQLGATYDLSHSHSLYGGVNTGYDLENIIGTRSRTGAPLAPETAKQAEIGLRGRLKGLRYSISAFDIKRQNVTTPDPIDPDFSSQTGEVTIKGLEVEGRLTPTKNLSLTGGFALMDGEVTRSNDGDEGALWPDTPKFQATLQASYALPKGFDLRLYGNHVGERALATASALRLKSYTTVDLGVGYHAKDWQADLVVSNLFDALYYTPAGAHQGQATFVYPGDPRAVSLRLSRKFH